MHKYLLCILATQALLACSSGGSSDDNDEPTNDTTITDSFASDLSVAATETAKRSIANEASYLDYESLPIGATIDNTVDLSVILKSKINPHINNATIFNDLPVGARVLVSTTVQGDCGGQIIVKSTIETPDSETEQYPRKESIAADFENYCLSSDEYTIVFNGELEASVTQSSTGNYEENYAYNINYISDIPLYPPGSLVAEERCIKQSDQRREVCTSSFSYESAMGQEFTLSNAIISGSAESGYSISGQISDSDGNQYSINVENFIQCQNGNVATGTIDIETENNDDIHIEFISCDEYVVTYQGVSQTLSQN